MQPPIPFAMDPMFIRNSISCEKRINCKYLVSGYSRENSASSFIPLSVLDVISYYYPSMNGHTFIWKLKLNEYCKSSSSSNIIDSDVFDIGVSNQFFLRLETNSPAIQSRESRKRERGRGRRRGRGRGRGRGGYNGNIDGRRINYVNNIYYDDDDPENKDNDNDDDAKDDMKCNNNLVLSVMSFPLPTPIAYQIFHCELYCHEINEQYSTIWNQTEFDHKEVDKYNNYGGYGDDDDQRGINTSNDNIYIEHGWVINYDLNRNYLELTFECKINILQIIFKDIYVRGQRHRFVTPNKRGIYGGYDDQYDPNEQRKEIIPYSYIALPLLNENNNNKMRFIWNIVDKSIIDKLTGYSDYKGVIQFHSDIFYDMFQLQIGREQYQNYFQIQICGLPAFTNKMGVKLQIFAMDMNNEENKIQIMSNIVTFSYDSPFYTLSNDKTNLLIDLLAQCKNLSILCIANIIHKYDKSGNAIKDEIKPMILNDDDDNNDNQVIDEYEEEKKEEKEEETKNNEECAKWLKYATDSFVWNIRDKTLMRKIKQTAASRFNSDPFELLGHKWYIAIYTADQLINKQRDMIIAVNCMLNKGNIDCLLKLELLQTHHEQKYYERFDIKWCDYPAQHQHHIPYLVVPISKIQRLNEITIKVTIGLINDNDNNNDCYLQTQCDDNDHDDNDKDKVKIWLKDKVCLPQYYPLFIQHGFNELNIVKLLSNDNILSMGIKKIGHRLKIIHEINKLKVSNNNNKSEGEGESNKIGLIALFAIYIGFCCIK